MIPITNQRWSPRLGTMGSWTITKYWLQYYQYYNIITPFLSAVSSLLDIYFSFLLSLSDCCRLNVQEAAADSQDSLSEIVWNGAETFYIEQTKWKWNQNIGEKITKTWKINRGNINTGKKVEIKAKTFEKKYFVSPRLNSGYLFNPIHMEIEGCWQNIWQTLNVEAQSR